MSCITELLKIKGEQPILKIGDEVAIEGGGIYRGYEYIITFIDRGHRCGYVAVPPGHPDADHDFIHDYHGDIAVHGGITFSGREHHAKDLLTHHCDDLWIGFDAMHGNDAPCVDTAKKYFGNSRYVELMSNEKDLWNSFGKHRTYVYMEKECRKVIRQLINKAALG